jgi:hypothetical protein
MELQIVSSIELLRMALVELERILEEKDRGRGERRA